MNCFFYQICVYFQDPVKEARIQKLAEDVFRSTKESEPSPETSAPKQQSADAGPVMEKLKVRAYINILMGMKTYI